MRSLIRFGKGAMSGLISGALLQPLNVIKTTMQVNAKDAEKFLGMKIENPQKS